MTTETLLEQNVARIDMGRRGAEIVRRFLEGPGGKIEGHLAGATTRLAHEPGS
jgi:hypothetical protein